MLGHIVLNFGFDQHKMRTNRLSKNESFCVALQLTWHLPAIKISFLFGHIVLNFAFIQHKMRTNRPKTRTNRISFLVGHIVLNFAIKSVLLLPFLISGRKFIV